MDFNKAHGIIPTTIQKSVRDLIEATKVAEEEESYYTGKDKPNLMSVEELEKLISKLQKEMKQAATDLQFERAAELRDKIEGLKKKI